MTAIKHVWTKFFWSDYANEARLQLCSFAAQGLWMRMLCIAAQHDPIGYVAVENRGLDVGAIARVTGGRPEEILELIGELERNGVFSRDRRGVIYCRRMIKDARKAAEARKNGKKGGNPSLSKDKGNRPLDNPPDKSRHKDGLKTHKPEARSQRESPPKGLSPGSWQGPSEIRKAVVDERGEGFAISYIDPAAWCDGSIRPHNGYAMTQLIHLQCLREAGVPVILPEKGKAA